MQKQLVGQRYRIKGLIGEGGMASVYAALDEKLDRRVAIKILHPHLARNPDIRQRFLLEAKTLSTLDHPNIIKVFDFSGLDSEQLWMVTEILYGIDLAEYLKRYPKARLHPIVATLVTREIARALLEVHKLHIVHRDIKPENIMMLDTGLVKLMDFGIAKVSRINATRTGTFMGSPSYMSPEQIRGSDVDVRADIYSLSVLFYEIVTGQLPFSGQTTAEVINKIVVGRYTSANLLAPDLPLAISEIIDKGLRSHKEERFQEIQQLCLAIDSFLNGFGFGESRNELEQYTADRITFDERLAKLKLPKTSIPKMESHKNILDQSKPTSSRSHHTVSAPNNPQKPKSQVASSRAPTLAPRSGRMPDSKSANLPSMLPAESKPNRTVADMRQGIDENQTQIIPGGNNRSPTQLGNSKPRESTISPSIQSGSHKVPHRSGLGHVPSKVRAIIREVRTQKRSRRSSNFSTIMILGLLGMIGLVFLFGGDKFANRVKKDSSKVTAQFDLNKKKKIGKETREELPNLATNNDPALKPRPSPEPIAPVVDSQTVIIDPVSTRIVEKESPSPRTSRVPNTVSKPLLGINRTKIPNQTPITAPNSDTIAKPKVSTLGEKPSQETRAPILASLPEKSSTQTDKIAPELPPNRDPGLLKVTALPAAEIYLNGKLFGTTNDRELNGIKLDPGSYTLRLKRKGYKTDEQQVQIKAGEQRALNVTLLKSVDLIALNIRCNRTPALLVIEDLLAGRRKEVSITKHNFSMNLRPGSYRVNVSFGEEVINRTVELSENEPSITFNAEFK